MSKVVLDSNVFVAAAFNRESDSARLVEWVRSRRLRLMWHRATRQETRHQLQKIPPISWEPFADLFAEENRVEGELSLQSYGFIGDKDDHKFAAVAESAAAVLVSNDQDLLSAAARLSVPVLTTGEAVARGRLMWA